MWNAIVEKLSLKCPVAESAPSSLPNANSCAGQYRQPVCSSSLVVFKVSLKKVIKYNCLSCRNDTVSHSSGFLTMQCRLVISLGIRHFFIVVSWASCYCHGEVLPHWALVTLYSHSLPQVLSGTSTRLFTYKSWLGKWKCRVFSAEV